ncbi:ATP-binding protein [Bacillus paranthracis]|uniref:ATP-binding protein n=1 Tax=Bacillus paranthracis TaxID=2026186 RepID=UPI002E1F7816|nr:ATP-binding protein [Bacillus paranthracis]MED1361501.1 ATP-binding protein [Bacillus paranthracis]
MASNKFEKELEKAVLKLVTKHWRFCLLLAGVLFVWITRQEIINRLIQIEPIVKRVVHTGLLLIVIVITIWVIRTVILYRMERKNYKYFLIIPHVSDEATAETLSGMIRQVHGAGRKPLEQLWKGRDWYRLLMYQPPDVNEKSEKLHFYLGGPTESVDHVIRAFQGVYVHAEVYEQTMDEVPFPKNRWFGGAVGGRMMLKSKKSLPLACFTKDTLPILLDGMAEKTWIDVSFSPDRGYRLTKNIRKAEADIKARKKKELGLDVFEKDEFKVLNKRFLGNETAFQVTVSMATEMYPGVKVLKGLGNIIASMMADVNELRYRSFRRSIWRVPCPYYGRMTWTGSELANLLHLPNITGDKDRKVEKKILYLDKGEEMLPQDRLTEGLGVGTIVHPLFKDRMVRITEEQFKKMGAIVGKTGSGKSTVAMNIMESALDLWLENPEEASGFSLFDPTPDLAIIALNRMMKAELDGKKVNWDKVRFIRFRNTKYPPGLNLLHRTESEDTETVIDSIMTSIKTIVSGQAVQTERILKAIIGTLLCDTSQTHTTLSIIAFGTDELFRERVLDNLEGPESLYYKHFWKNEIGNALEDSIQPLLNRLDIFRSTTYLKRIYGQSDFSLDIRKWMDEGYIIFYDLSGMGNADIQLTIGYIKSQYHRVVQQRPIGSKLHLSFIDEAHKVQVPILPKIVAEDRKYGLGLWIITQQISGQLDKDLADALKEIGGNFFVCRQGEASAKTLEGIMQRQFRAQYLQDLPDLVAAVQTQDKIDGKAQNVWCTVEVKPLDRYLPNGKVANYQDIKEIEKSNEWTFSKIAELEKRGKSAEELDQEINAFLFGKEAATSIKVNLEKEESIFARAEEEVKQEESIFARAEEEAKQEESIFARAEEEAKQEESIFARAEEEVNQEESPVIMDMPFPWEMKKTDHLFVKKKEENVSSVETDDDSKEEYPFESEKDEPEKEKDVESKEEKSIFDF